MKIFYLLVNYYTGLHQRISLNKKSISSFLLICFYIQLLSVIVQPTYNNQLEMKVMINFFNIFYSLSQIGRPYQTLLKYENFRQYCFLIPISVIIFLKIIFLISQLQKMRGNKLIKNEYIQNSFLILKSFENGLSIWIQIYYFAFNLYFLDFCSLSLIEQINQSQINVAFIIVISICYVIVILFALLNLFCQETLQFPCYPLKFENVTFEDAFSVIITAASLIFSNLTQDWQHILFRMMNCLNIGIHIRNEVYRINSSYNFLSLIILSSTFSYCIADFLFFFVNDKKLQIALVLILCPFWTNILYKLQARYCAIRLDKKRNLQQIYNNLVILHQLNKNNATTFALNTFKYILEVSTNEELFQKELTLLNTKALRSDKAKQIYWNKKYVIIKYSLKNVTQTLSLIHNFKNNQFYMESKNQFIKVQLNLSYLQGLQLDHLKQMAQLNLYKNLENRNISIDLLEISDLIHKKIQSSKLIEQMYQLLAEKYSLYINILKNYQNPKVDLYTALYNLTERGLALKQSLKFQFEQYKTSMLQQMLVLINVEFFNNILQAQVIKYSQVIPDVKSDVFEKKEYLIIHLKDDLKNLKLNSYSPKLIEALGYKQKQIVKDLQFEQLIPFEFLQTHQMLVLNFLDQGVCKFFNSSGLLFLKGAGNIFFHSTAEIYLQPSIYNDITFYHFVQLKEDQPLVLIVNNNQQILGYTEPLLKLFQSLDLPRLPLLYLQNINLVFVNFSKLKIDEEQKNYKLICMSSNKIVPATIYIKYEINYIFFQFLDQYQEVYEKSQEQIIFQPIMPSINTESVVEIPKNIFDNLNSPLSMDLTKRNGQDTKLLLKSQSMTEQKIFGSRSRDGSEKVSSAEKQMFDNDHKIIEYDEEKLQAMNNVEKESSKYTRGVLKNSLFNDKYEKLNDYLNQRKASSFHYLAASFLFVGILTNLIFYIINTVICVPKYEQANADTNILAIKSFFMTPIHDFVTAQSATVSYIKLVYLKEITLEEGTQKKQFALASINESYIWLKNSFTSELTNQNLEQFFSDNQVSMWQIVNESLVVRNISLKNSLYYYLEAQYYLSLIDIDQIFYYIPNNDYIYYMSNLINIDNYFDELNDYTLSLVNTRIDLMLHDYIDLVLKFGMLNFIFITISFCYVLKYYYNNKLYFKLLTDMNILAVQKEMQKLERILGYLQNERSFKDYNYELSDWERQIKAYETPLNQKGNQKRVSSNIYHQKKLLIYIYFLAILITLIIPLFILQSLNNTFCIKYRSSSQFLKTLSISSSAITALYEIREINYMINEGISFFYFYTDEKRLEQNVKVLQILDQINYFMQQLISMNEEELLCDLNFKNVYGNMKSGNLCNFMLHFDSSLALNHCKLIYSGVMELGLYNTVNKIYNQIMTEYQNTNGFEAKLRKLDTVNEELEIGLIASDAVLYVQKALFDGILSQKNQIVTLHQVIGGLFISLDTLFIIVLLFYLLPYYQVQFQIIKQMILIVPSYQFYLDKTFESNFRIYKIQQT